MYNIHIGLNLKQIFIYTGKGSNSLLNHSDLKVAGFHTYKQKREHFVNYFLKTESRKYFNLNYGVKSKAKAMRRFKDDPVLIKRYMAELIFVK